MDIQALWLLALAIATPFAGVVGFAIQLRQVKKVRLENEKLQLEIASLKAAEANRVQRVLQVTTEEVVRYTRPPLLSRSRGPNPGPEAGSEPERSASGIKDKIVSGSFLLLILLFLTYVVYDIYRVFRWLANAL